MSKRLHLVVRLTYDPQVMHGGEADPEARRWFYEQVLGGRLVLTSPEVGEIGEVEVVEVSDEEAYPTPAGRVYRNEDPVPYEVQR